MVGVRFIKQNFRLITRIVQWIVFLLCLAGFSIQSYDCLKTYLECPIGVEISSVPQTEMDFPSITFCPKDVWHNPEDPLPYDWTKLDTCGINNPWMIFYFGGHKCNNREDWESVTPVFQDFGFQDWNTLTIRTFHDKKDALQLNINETEILFEKHRSVVYGACYTLNLPKNITGKGIKTLQFGMDSMKSMLVFVHPQGLLNTFDPSQSIEVVGKPISKKVTFTFTVDYYQKIDINRHSTKCETDKSYDFTKCMENSVLKVSTLTSIKYI